MKYDWSTYPKCETCEKYHNNLVCVASLPEDCPKVEWVENHKAELLKFKPRKNSVLASGACIGLCESGRCPLKKEILGKSNEKEGNEREM